ncbi:MAG: hypothetical protein MUE88_11375 [Flavobacteriales bacterium]|nr:hypothetical protein [Flavobacteriales bacterium]
MDSCRSLTLVLVLGLSACSQGPDVMGKGPFQARKYRPGWHLDLRSGNHQAAQRTSARPLEARLPPPPDPTPGHPIAVPVAALELAPTPPPKAPKKPAIAPGPPRRSVHPTTDPIAPQDEPENLMPKKRWNWMGVVAFLMAGGTVLLGFSALGTTAVLIAAVLTALVAGLTLRRIRKREQAGKGFALIALLVAVIALVITGVSIAVLGFS